MSRINLLQPEVYNIIAAGEVIEKPVGAVKELVENCIDAAANRIVIEVVGGGFDLISVTDNGLGINAEDVELAFAKHATSKIQSADDLYAVGTMGFRGEALPSIASISHVKLTTRTRSSDMGVCITVEDGVVTGKEYVACNIGTKVEVRGLFHNVPVQRNYFKSVGGEAADITKYVARLILSNPQLTVSYILDGKQIYSTNGDGLAEAIFAVYGADCLSQCLQVSLCRDNIRVYGYIGNPQYTKANKIYQTLSVNGRYIVDANISGSIMQAFRPYIMQRQYPFYVLNVDLPHDRINVNVHPKKMEVRFADYQRVCSAFYHGVQDALEAYAARGFDAVVQPAQADHHPKVFEQEELLDRINGVMEDIEPPNPDQKEDIDAMDEATSREDYNSSFDELAERIEREVSVEKARQFIGLGDSPSVKRPSLTAKPAVQSPPQQISEADKLWFRTRILGVAFKTYLILEIDDNVILVDQHAAHERILFDKFLARKTGNMQQLLVPYAFTVRDEEAAFIEENLSNILAAGIQVEPFGHNTFRIVAVSTLLIDTEMKDFVEFLLASIDDYKLDDRTLIVEKIAQKACKAAVKAGYRLNEYEIKYVVQEIYNNKILQCPHGRPIAVTLTKKQIEKMFKRIV